MKKTYIIPVTQCVTIRTECYIAASLPQMSADGGTVATYDTELEGGIVGESRGHNSLWGDDEE
ncbi:MAG: hypothetical protein J6Z14_08610 [Prevotella sp.]|nr:hypothetical protein [Prevotella sp.]